MLLLLYDDAVIVKLVKLGDDIGTLGREAVIVANTRKLNPIQLFDFNLNWE